MALAIGLVILSVAFLRLLQTETGKHLPGQLVVGALPDLHGRVVAVAAVAVKAVSRGQKRTGPGPEKESA